ncbi:hypothetical protein H5410_015541 [Solanum commersonii]|uniref:Uncharacterized protein n=1 Tax=Solanum commersonii TaxID=4109 RepID=A0A9J5ZTT3_SOLCO|nr:hypothetical protein H5410_015541 [Solanum commersonii]
MGEWIKRGPICSSFFQKKDKAQKGSSSKSLHHLVNWTNGVNSRCHYTRFTVSSSHKALEPISNKTPHFC